MRWLVIVTLVAAGCGEDTERKVYPWGPIPPLVSADVDAGVRDASTDGAAPADAPAADAAQPCPTQVGTISVVGGVLNGQTLTAGTPTVQVAAGELLVGTVLVQVTRKDGCSACPFALAYTATWDDPTTGFGCAGNVATTSASRNIDISGNASGQVGTHYLVVAGRASSSCAEVMSAGSPTLWGDGNDVAGWSPFTILEAMSQGSVCIDWKEAGTMTKVRVPAAAVRIIVQ